MFKPFYMGQQTSVPGLLFLTLLSRDYIVDFNTTPPQMNSHCKLVNQTLVSTSVGKTYMAYLYLYRDIYTWICSYNTRPYMNYKP